MAIFRSVFLVYQRVKFPSLLHLFAVSPRCAAFPVAGLLGTVAFAWAAGSSSGLISMIENGTYTMMSAAGWNRDSTWVCLKMGYKC